jgi:hypothetical protein
VFTKTPSGLVFFRSSVKDALPENKGMGQLSLLFTLDVLERKKAQLGSTTAQLEKTRTELQRLKVTPATRQPWGKV